MMTPTVTASSPILRICLDSVHGDQRHDADADIFGEIALDSGKGQRCQLLAARHSAGDLGGFASDGAVARSWHHHGGVFSHHVACSEQAGECSFYSAHCTQGDSCRFSSLCNPARSPCYSVPQYERLLSQALWCCDFAHDLAVAAKVARVELWDESSLGDDRVGRATVAIPAVLAALRADGSFNATHPLSGSRPSGATFITVWAGFLSTSTEVDTSSSGASRRSKAPQISYWGQYGPNDIKALARHRENPPRAPDGEAVAWHALQGPARHMREFQRWQQRPVLGSSEQLPEVVRQRKGTLSAALASEPELGLSTGRSGVCVVSTATGPRYDGTEPLGAALLRNKQQFCKACGYRCLLSTRGDHVTGRPAKWDKLLSLHDALRSCRVALHVDADVIFRRAFEVESVAQTWLSATRDFDGLNSGVLLLRRTKQARELLERAWALTSFNRSFSAEQNALRLALRRPYNASSRSRIALVTILEGLVEYPFYHSPLLNKLQRDLNYTAPLVHVAGCTANRLRASSGFCEKTLHDLIPNGSLGTCGALEAPYATSARALLQHLQAVGSTNLGRRWLKGRDLRIKYTDQKGSRKDGWWETYPGCWRYGCDDPDARIRADKAERRSRERAALHEYGGKGKLAGKVKHTKRKSSKKSWPPLDDITNRGGGGGWS